MVKQDVASFVCCVDAEQHGELLLALASVMEPDALMDCLTVALEREIKIELAGRWSEE